MSSARDKRIDRAQLKVLFQVPFFAPAVCKLPVVWDPSIPTACTDGKEIRWNPEWFDKLQDQEVVTVLCHEVEHCMFGHLWRMPPGGDPDVWNQACDHAVNLQLKEFSQVVMGKRLADPFPFPDPDSICCDPQYANMAEEVIYNKLANKPKGKGQGKRGKPGAGAGQPGGHKPFGEFTQGKLDPAQQKAAKTDWEHTLIQCSELAKGRGDVPGGIARMVGELLEPKVPWFELLRNWLREQAADDWNFMKANPYFSTSDFLLPILESEKIGPVVFATDTSGSIDADWLAHFQTEKQSCLDDMKPSRLLDLYCDTRITKVAEYHRGEQISLDAPGGGGTRFEPVFDHIAKLEEQPKCLVYLTDLDGSFPDKDPGFPVLWVTWDKDGKAPFGEVIKIA